MSTKKIIVGNWKMDPNTFKEAKKIFQGILKKLSRVKQTDVVLCPPTLFFEPLKQSTQSKKIALGAQDISREASGSHTGEVSAHQFAQAGATYVIVGHSERRALGDSDEIVAHKIKNAREEGMSTIVCVGESNRDDDGEHLTFLHDEIIASLGDVGAEDLKHIIIAYEPIWAIGKNAEEAMGGHELHQMYLYIKKVLIEKFGRTATEYVRIIYGGSVTPDNVRDIVAEGHVDGVLPGRASRDPEQFTEIIKIVSEL